MAWPLSNTEISGFSTTMALGNVWDAASATQRQQAVETAENLWRALPWSISPFDSDVVGTAMQGSLMVHAQHVLENENRPIWPEGLLQNLFLSGYLQGGRIGGRR